ncbi:MAG: terminase family protein [Pseudomonadota bacterium]
MTSLLPMWNLWFQNWKRKAVETYSREQIEFLAQHPFLLSAHPGQRPSAGAGDWRNWLFLGGRGAGKTRAGAEWVRYAVNRCGVGRVALVAPTLHDAREVMIEGVSGLRNLGDTPELQPVYHSSKRVLEWPNGAVAHVFSAEEPDRLRGPQFELAWCDEVAAWKDGEAVWDTLQMGLRLGTRPQCAATTTPRPVPLIKRLIGGEAIVTKAPTSANAHHLAPSFMADMQRHYGGTALARQELDGDLLEDPEEALWTRSMIEAGRTVKAPERFDDIIVAIDPPASSGANADACGIIAAGLVKADGFGQRCFILSDGSVQGLRPLDWGARVAALARHVGARAVIAEANQGGEMVRAVLESAGCDVPVELRHAKVSKSMRAAPVAALYARGDVAHIGVFRDLEDEMCRFGAQGFVGSPDSVDALVWAVTALMLEGRDGPRVRGI